MEGKDMSASSNSFAGDLQRSLARLVKKQEGLCWSFQNVDAFETASFLLACNERLDHKRRRERARRRDTLQMCAGFLALQEGDLEAITSTSSHDARHTEGVDSAMPGMLLSSSQAGEPSPRSMKVPLLRQTTEPSNHGWIEKAALASIQAKAMMKEISPLERAQIGAGAGGIAGAITYACLHPLDTIKTKLQTRGASYLYSGPLDVIVKTFQKQGVLGFYSGISAVLVGSVFSSAIYFGTCELGKALLVKVPSLPAVVVPPTIALGNIASSAILIPKELITQRMQIGAQGSHGRTVETEGVKGLYTGYLVAFVRNLTASVLSFSSFEYLKSTWMKKTGNNELFQGL